MANFTAHLDDSSPENGTTITIDHKHYRIILFPEWEEEAGAFAAELRRRIDRIVVIDTGESKD